MNNWMKRILLGMALSAVGNLYAEVEPTFITIASGRVHGNYYKAAQAICDRVNLRQEEHGIRCSVAYSDGSIANLTSIRAGEYELGIVQSDSQYYAVHGSGPFAGRTPFKELRSLMSLFPEAFTIIAHPDKAIRTMQDLRGKRVDMGNPGSGSRTVAEMIMLASGMQIKDFSEVVSLNILEQIAAFCENRLDALMMTVGHPDLMIKEYLRHCSAMIVAPEKEVVEKVVKQYSFFSSTLIPGGIYEGNPEPLTTIGVRATLVASSQLPDKVAYELVKSVFSDIEAFNRADPVLFNLNSREMVREALTAPIHEGAKAYYLESGLLDDKMLD